MDDLIIVGAGPSGLSAAIFAAEKGMKVRVFDHKTGVIDKACGEGLAPKAKQLLDELQIPIRESLELDGIRYIQGRWQADGHFKDGKVHGIRRLQLHEGFRNRAQSLGIPIEQAKVREIEQYGDHVCVHGHRARYAIAADGLRSPIRKSLGLERHHHSAPRYGLRQHFNVKPWSNFVEVHWGDLAEAYVTPVSPTVVGVALLFGDEFRKSVKGDASKFYTNALRAFPAVNDHCTKPCSTIRGAGGPFKTVLSSRIKGRILLVGDAAGYLDPITGEGIRLSIHSAKLAVDAIASNDIASYEKQWYRASRAYWWHTAYLLRISGFPPTRRSMVPLLNRVPFLFDQILSRM